MIKVGLTGNIGSGKSTVAKIFKILGTPVYFADDEAKKIYQNSAFLKELAGVFGNQIIVDDQLNRQVLANIVFNDSNKLEQLNAMVHPKVRSHFVDWTLIHQDQPYVIQEAAILIESGFYKMFDKIILVTADEESRMKRVIKRDKVDKNAVVSRMANQMTEEEKAKYADFIIRNNDDQMLIRQVLEIHNKLLK